MKKVVLFLCFSLFLFQAVAQTTITVLDSVIFYDGYAKVETLPPPPAGVVMHRSDLYARKLTTSERLSIGTSLQMRVVLKALCDNYDRLGSVHMALVPSGSNSYNPDSVQRIELGRFITPFMNKNVQPDTVSFVFNIDNVAPLLKDPDLASTFDIWIELSVFGIPYAAQKEVIGCSTRNDVFSGTLELSSNQPTPTQHSTILIPLFFHDDFNNYKIGATDTIGLTTKGLSFNVPCNLTDAAFFLITSNHGANEGGEEYIRRDHFVYFDGMLKCMYKPGRLSCEPFRTKNTQSNGIYGKLPKSDEDWQSFSNWCPGDVIDIHRIDLGSVLAGSHSFLIRAPSAVFEGKQGNIPLSLYLQGSKSSPSQGY